MPALVEVAREFASRLRVRPVVPHPSLDEVDVRNRHWARVHGLVDDDAAAMRHAAIRCASFAAHTYPRAPEDVVALGADLITWLFLFDDEIGEGVQDASPEALRTRLAGYEHTVRTGVCAEDATTFHRALLDLRRRASLRGSDVWLSRFANSLTMYFIGCVLELPFRLAGRTPPLDEYRSVRALSIGAYPVFDLIELGSGVLDADVRACAEVEEAREAAALLCAWVNDIYSFPKEHHDGEPVNLVAALAMGESLSPERAFEAAIELFHVDLDSFERRIRDTMATTRDPQLVAYLTGLDDWVHGNTQWTGLCGRYTPS